MPMGFEAGNGSISGPRRRISGSQRQTFRRCSSLTPPARCPICILASSICGWEERTEQSANWNRRPACFYTLAVAYAQAKKPDRAAAARRRFAALRERADLSNVLAKRCAVNPNDFGDHLQMGLIALEDGDPEKADFFLNRARRLRPSDPKLIAALQRLAEVSDETKSAGADGQR